MTEDDDDENDDDDDDNIYFSINKNNELIMLNKEKISFN